MKCASLLVVKSSSIVCKLKFNLLLILTYISLNGEKKKKNTAIAAETTAVTDGPKVANKCCAETEKLNSETLHTTQFGCSLDPGYWLDVEKVVFIILQWDISSS